MINDICKDFDALTTELIATKSQLASKCEAIKILSQKLEESLNQTDELKLMIDQLQERYKTLKKALGTDTSFTDTLENSQRNVFFQLKVKLHEGEIANRILESEVITLRRRIAELSDDLEVLQKNHPKQEENEMNNKLNCVLEREALVRQFEEKSLECSRLRRDLQFCQDEKNELFAELQVYKNQLFLNASDPVSTLTTVKLPIKDEPIQNKDFRLKSGTIPDSEAPPIFKRDELEEFATSIDSHPDGKIASNAFLVSEENPADIFADVEPLSVESLS